METRAQCRVNAEAQKQRDIFPSFIASEDIDSSDIIEQSFREITETCNAIVDSMDVLERTIVDDLAAGGREENTRDISFCEIASPSEDPQAERTQNIVVQPLSEQKHPNRTLASQQKDQWIEKIRSECRQTAAVRPNAIYVCGRCQDDLDDNHNLLILSAAKDHATDGSTQIVLIYQRWTTSNC